MFFTFLAIALLLAMLAMALSALGIGAALVIQAFACTAIVDVLMFGALGLLMLGVGISILVVIVCLLRGDI